MNTDREAVEKMTNGEIAQNIIYRFQLDKPEEIINAEGMLEVRIKESLDQKDTIIAQKDSRIKELEKFIDQVESEVSKVYCHITNNKLSKITYEAVVVTSEADSCYEEQYSKDIDLLESKLAVAVEALNNYGEHDKDCICAQYQGGRPTEDGGYEMLYGYGKEQEWCKEMPPCTCGFKEALIKIQGESK